MIGSRSMCPVTLSGHNTADTFLVTPATIASWVKRIDEKGPDALLQLLEPVNKFPDFVRYIVHRTTSEDPESQHGKGRDRRDAVPGRTASGGNDGWTDFERSATDCTWGCDTEHAHRDRQSSQPCLACRPHGRADISGILGSVVAVRITPVLAVLLVGGSGHRPPLATSDGH